MAPETCGKLVAAGMRVVVEPRAGVESEYTDDTYTRVGCTIGDPWAADVVAKIRAPTKNEISKLRAGQILFSYIYPRQDEALVESLRAGGVTAFGLDCVPRTLSRAQAFDTLSSMANISGYRAVVEAANALPRFFAGQFTMAGNVLPAKVLVVGAGVAGLAAVQTAKNMGAVVRAFDVRAAVREQVESMGAEFLEVTLKESGDGEGGYAKEMSPEFIEAEMALFAAQCAQCDVVITTALIPGRPAPKLITRKMVESMKPGSVTVDLASEAGGNIETTLPGEVVRTANGVTCVGYTDLPSRCAGQSSTLFGNNVANLLLSMGDSKQGQFQINHHDEAVRGALVTQNGKVMFPPPPVPKKVARPPSTAAAAISQTEEEKPLSPEWLPDAKSALAFSGFLVLMVAVGAGGLPPEAVGLVSMFSLACIVGYFAVSGVSAALHSPLMSVTNAISGMTAIGALELMRGGLLPDTWAGAAAAAAVAMSAVNIAGGFVMTGRMLDMFRRPDDPKTYSKLLFLPVLGTLAYYLPRAAAGAAAAATHQTVALASALCCVGAISMLSSQRSARTGNALGAAGVVLGLAATAGPRLATAPAGVLAQAAGALGAGGILGLAIAARCAITDLPQLVAAFHSLVGLAATLTSVVAYATHPSCTGAAHLGATWFGVFIGAVTFTGSVVAFAKLKGLVPSKEVSLPFKGVVNGAAVAGSVATGAAFFRAAAAGASGDAVTALAGVAVLGAFLGTHATLAIGGADTPVVITVLNSSSGWALAAEGFVLGSQLLTVVGALIGASGWILSQIMCVAMNRSIVGVLLGIKGTLRKKTYTRPAAGVDGAELCDPVRGECVVSDAASAARDLADAKSVLVVPGYGLAVSKAQYAMSDLITLLRANGKEVAVAVHPVAGRMPGQLNVLLAEAGVPYDIVKEMEEVEGKEDRFDVSLVVGANDTVNPAAVEDPESELAGMPVIQVWRSRKVLVLKRSLAGGYADVDNPLFFNGNTNMVLGDAKATIEEMREMLEEMLGSG
uniref:proton-translocating NAD(P)(+) transhydrogenase n=2 Tax=Mantoniella antarctica TaxID=81844 RepID=A0A7S0SHF6_9CHLO